MRKIKLLIPILIILLCFIDYYGAEETGIKNSPALKQQLTVETNPFPGSGYSYTETSGGNFGAQEGFLTIKRNVRPNYKDFYLKNKMNLIEVEIQGCGRAFNDVLIKEKIDPELGNFSDLNIFIENPFTSTNRVIKEKISKYSGNNETKYIKETIDEMKENFTLENNTIYIKIPKLNSRENIKYNYKIHSIKAGIFDIVTRLRLNESKWPDLERMDPIEVRPPEIQVNIESDKSFAIKNKPLNLTYSILHKSGWSKEALYFYLKFNPLEEYTIYYENGTLYKNENINLTLLPLEATKLLMKVKYNEAGQHPLPSLDIEGATISQDNNNIEVISSDLTKSLQDNIVLISLVISIIAIFITIFDFQISRKEIDSLTQITTNKIPPVYDGLKKDLLLEFYIFIFLGGVWMAINYSLSRSILSSISLPIILGVILSVQYFLIKKYE
jgi:hypothetical protein